MKIFFVVLLVSLAVLISAQEQDNAEAEPANEYLPPPTAPAAELKETAELADDGYRYKTIRKLKYRARHRRDVSQEYLPPVEKSLQEYLPPAEETAANQLDDDGYHYQTVRKLKFRARHRRDVSEIEQPSNDYLPPVDVELSPDLKTVLADDGYRYNTVRRLKFRRHRREANAIADVAPVNGYLPPTEETVTAIPADSALPADSVTADLKSAELADDGYRYKTVRKIRYRTRI